MSYCSSLMIAITANMFWLALYGASNKYYWSSPPSLLMHPPSHLQRAVHLTPALLHLHLPVHALVQPQCKRMAHATEASLRVVHSGCHILVPSLCQPHSLKSGISCWTEVA